MGWQDGDMPLQQQQNMSPTPASGFGQEYVPPTPGGYQTGTQGTGQEMRPTWGSLNDFATARPDDWYLDPQAKNTPEAQSAFTSAFNKGPTNKDSWWDWAQHIQKFYGRGAVSELAGAGWFDRFNMSSEDQNALGRHVQQIQDGPNDPLFGNSGFTIPQAIMMLGSAAVGGASGWAGGGAAGAGTASLPAGISASTAETIGPIGVQKAVEANAAGAFTGAVAGNEEFGSFDPGGEFQDTGESSRFLNSEGFGGDFDVGSFADPNFGAFSNPAGGAIDPSGFGSSFDASPGYGPTNESSWLDEWRKKLMTGKGARGVLGIGSGIYGMQQARQMQKLSQQAMERSDPFGPERAGYAAKLRDLYADPSAVEKLPGYKAGLTAVERKMAAQGYNGSGNMMIALKDYGENAFNSEAKRLSELAGAGMRPDTGAAINARAAATNQRGNSLASLAFGIANLF